MFVGIARNLPLEYSTLWYAPALPANNTLGWKWLSTAIITAVKSFMILAPWWVFTIKIKIRASTFKITYKVMLNLTTEELRNKICEYPPG
jgi:hypothetical protein